MDFDRFSYSFEYTPDFSLREHLCNGTTTCIQNILVSIVQVQLPYLFNIYIICTTIKLCDKCMYYCYTTLYHITAAVMS